MSVGRLGSVPSAIHGTLMIFVETIELWGQIKIAEANDHMFSVGCYADNVCPDRITFLLWDAHPGPKLSRRTRGPTIYLTMGVDGLD